MLRPRATLRLWPQLALAAFLAAAPAAAQENYPSQTIRLVVPVPPGGPSDVLPRLLAEKLAAKWGQPVVVENRPGAALNLAARTVAEAKPDGYTLLVTPPGPLTTSQVLYKDLGFDPDAFVPVSILAEVPFVLVAGPKTQVSTLQEMIALAKANPGKLHLPSLGPGSPPHLVGEMLNRRAGVRLALVPYQGLVPALNAVLNGEIEFMFFDVGTTAAHIASGKLKALGAGSERRLKQLPDVPAIAEFLPGFVATTWFTVVAPPKTPPEIAAKLSQAFAEALREPDIAKRLDGFSASAVGTSPADTAAFLKREGERWRNVVREAGIKVQ